MPARVIMGLWFSLSLTTMVLAENWIEEWGGDPTVVYDIDQFTHEVVLESPGTFKFWAYDPADPTRPPGHIESITVAPAVSGVINLYIAHPDGPDYWGAYDLDLVNLSGQAEANIVECRIANTLAADGKVVATRIDGACYVGREVLHDMQVQSLHGEVNCLTMQDLTVTGATPGPIGTRIVIRSGPAYAHAIAAPAHDTKPGQTADLHMVAPSDNMHMRG